MPTRFHAFMQHPYYLHQSWSDNAVKQDVHGPSHTYLISTDPCVSEMKVSNATRQLNAVTCQGAVRFHRNFAHRGREKDRIATPAFKAPSFAAHTQDLREVGARQQ